MCKMIREKVKIPTLCCKVPTGTSIKFFKTYEKGARELWENPENRTKKFYGICFKILDFTLRENFDDYDCHYFPDSFSMVRILRILLVEVDRSGFQIRLSYSIAIRP